MMRAPSAATANFLSASAPEAERAAVVLRGVERLAWALAYDLGEAQIRRRRAGAAAAGRLGSTVG